jgi:hypothetical protein
MSKSYQTVKDHSVTEWGFSKAKLVKQYVRPEEKNFLSTVPAPFVRPLLLAANFLFSIVFSNYTIMAILNLVMYL